MKAPISEMDIIRLRSVPHINAKLEQTQNTLQEVVSRSVVFALLGTGKPAAGIAQSGELQIEMVTEPHPLNKYQEKKFTKILFGYFDITGTKHVKEFSVPNTALEPNQFVEWFDLLLSLEGYDTGEDENFKMTGFTEEIHREFISRLNNANRNPKYSQRFRAAANIGMWGI